MTEMEETVKSLTLDEKELDSKITRRKQELERAEKRLKGIIHVKPENQEEYDKLEVELERFYSIYVEKYANIDFLEHEMDKFNLIEKESKKKQRNVIANIQDGIENDEQEAINNIGDGDDDAFGQDQMRNTRTGFGGGFGGGGGKKGQMQA
jgi:clusterin-associated protein 1